MNIKRAPKLIDDIQGVVSEWKSYADKVLVSKEKRDAIATTHLTV